MSNGVVLDASAILAVLWDERGAEKVAPHFADGQISSVNLGEVISKMVDRAATEVQIAAVVAGLGPRVQPATMEQAVAAGKMRAQTRTLGLSLGDRHCLALAAALGARVLTADRSWAGLNLGISIETIR